MSTQPNHERPSSDTDLEERAAARAARQEAKLALLTAAPTVRVMLSSLFNLLGGIAGLLAIGIVLWRGGALERQLEIDTAIIANIQATGSSTLQTHIKSDDERVSELARRVGQAEELARQGMELKVEVRVLGQKIDGVVKQLEVITQNSVISVKQRP